MAAPGEKSFCVLEYHTRKSVVTVQSAFLAKYAKAFVPPLPRDPTDLKTWFNAAVKNIDAPMLKRVCGKNLNIVYQRVPCQPWCTHRTFLVVKKYFFSFPVAVNNSIKVGPLVFLVINVCKHREHYEIPCIDSTSALCSGSSRFIDAEATDDIHAYRPL